MSYAIYKTFADIHPLYNLIRDRFAKLGVIITVPAGIRAEMDDYYSKMGWFGYADAYNVSINGVSKCVVPLLTTTKYTLLDQPCP
jgi:hypothetical protein